MTIFLSHLVTALGVAILLVAESGFASSCQSSPVKDAVARALDEKGSLRSKFVAQDYFTARPCFDDFSDLTAATLDEKLESDYQLLKCDVLVLEGKRICTNEADRFEVKPEWEPICNTQGKCLIEYYSIKTQLPTNWRKFAGSGNVPLGWLLGHIGKKGHYEITTMALKDFAQNRKVQLSNAAVAIMSTGSQDADFYHWTNAAAHGQTPNDDSTGKLISGPAAENFVEWTKSYLRKAESNCQKGKFREAIYLIGYALHAVQDLVFHDGMSNAEHAYRDEFMTAVDSEYWYDEKTLLAKEASLAIVDSMLPATPLAHRPCSAVISSTEGIKKLRSDEKILLIGKNQWDLTWTTYWSFKGLAQIMKNSGVYDNKYPKEQYIVEPKWLVWDNYFKSTEATSPRYQ